MPARIASLTYQPAASERVAAQRVTLVAGHGIDGDRKAGRNPKRHLNLMSASTLARLSVAGAAVQPGQLGEQMAVDGLDVSVLPRGTRLQLGDTATIEITMPRDGCAQFAHVQGITQHRLGVMARVVEGGVLSVGDSVYILETV